MTVFCGKRKLRAAAYQTEMKPGLAAREMRRSTALRTSPTPLLGTDGSSRVYPFWGRIKRISEGLLKSVQREAGASIALFASLLSSAALVLAMALILAGYPTGDLWAVVALSGAATIAERGKIKLSSTAEASISLFPQLITAVLFGPLAAMIVSVASMLGHLSSDILLLIGSRLLNF